MPYTMYSVYMTAVKLIGDTGRLLEGMQSNIVVERTLAGGESKQFMHIGNVPKCPHNHVAIVNASAFGQQHQLTIHCSRLVRHCNSYKT